ncbi:MAG: polyisoprenoid-binding protein [Candidatus Zixiibacteriota bacterium]|nr:MAG: polyisoprenoid-binding protein [candidate division Zixibacteria bacterium]
MRILILSTLILVLAGTASASTWETDSAHSHLGFAARHMMISKVRGSFDQFAAVLTFDEQETTRSSVQLTIQAASLDTDNDKRDEHLRGADFFDAGNHPQITFTSRRVERSGDRLILIGDLTLRGVTREVAVEIEELTPAVTDPFGHRRMAVSVRTRIDRRDFGLTWNKALETGGVLVGDEVDIYAELELIRK